MARIAGTAKSTIGTPTNISAELMLMNDGVRICSEACSCCWDTPLPDDYEGKVVYLGKRAKIGHTSIFEHSNLDILIYFRDDAIVQNTEALPSFLSNCEYLKTAYAKDEDSNYILIGGSWRGYIDLYEKMKDDKDNPFLRAITPVLWRSCDGRIFYSLINEGIIDDRFTGVEPDPTDNTFCPARVSMDNDKLKIVSHDDLPRLRRNIFQATGKDLFNYDDLAKFATATVLFKNMSRTCTHQLVRHRNAVTQESQRYVRYDEAAFADPTLFKPDKYDPDKVYDVHFGGQTFKMTSNQLGEAICGFYQDMLDQGMLKEDARSFLPGNVKCRKIYMTFTYDHLMKFLELRCDPHAQAEIRSFALVLKVGTDPIFDQLKEDIDKVLKVDEIISVKDEASIIETALKMEEKEND